MQINRDALVQTFLAETEETLGQMEQALLLLEERPGDEELIGLVFRVAHMLKGNAAGLGLKEVSGFAHAIEDLLSSIRARTVIVTKDVVNLLLKAVDALRSLVPKATSGNEELDASQQELLQCIHALSAVLPAPVTPASVAPAAEGQAAATPADPQSSPVSPASSVEHANDRTLRINIEKLDRLLNLAGEIGIAQGRLRQLIEKLELGMNEHLLESLHEADRLTMELQEQVMDLRMVPIGPMFHRYVRMIRDLASTHGKQARLLVNGEEAGVDTAVIAHIRDPLTHMIRNAIDHGIEFPEVRKTAGKNPIGTIYLRAFREAGTFVIQLADDGAGLNREKIVQRARAMGLSIDLEKLTHQEVYRLIFEPGFSTADEITETSGRGVGMDIVRRNIEALHGRVEIDSEDGLGVTVTIRLPLTLAIIEGFSVGVASDTYVLPLDAVVECMAMPAYSLEGNDGQGVITLRGEPLPFIRLRNLFNAAGSSHREHVVVVRYQGGHAGIVVDELRGEIQAVIKPLGNLFQNLPGISGSTILGDGRIALVLDVPGLYRASLQQETAAQPQ